MRKSGMAVQMRAQTRARAGMPAVVLDPGRLGPLGLTSREREVLTWVSAGRSNGEIGAILHCAPKTVEKHLEHIYAKLDVPNRAAAAATAAMLFAVGG